MLHVSNTKQLYQIHATPAKPSHGWKHGAPAYFDTVLIIEDTEKHHMEGGIAGVNFY
jgi:hypothetical protein